MNKIKYLLLVLCLFITTNVYAEETATTKSISNEIITSTTRPRSSQDSTKRTTYNTNDYGNSGYSHSSTGTSTIQIKDVEGTSYKLFIDDKENLLSDAEEEKLFSDMEILAPYGNMGFISLSSTSGTETSLAYDYYISHFGQTNGIIFMINMGTRQLTIRTIAADSPNGIINSDRIDSILANVYRYAKKGDYYSCVKKAYEQMYTLLTGKTIFEPMKIASNAILAFAISSFILYIYVLSSSSIKKASNKELMNSIKRDVNIGEITFRPNGTRRVYSPQTSSSSGGGSSGGGGGGGGSSGGSHGF